MKHTQNVEEQKQPIGNRVMSTNNSWRMGWKVVMSGDAGTLLSVAAPRVYKYHVGGVAEPHTGCGPLTVFKRKRDAEKFAKLFGAVTIVPCEWEPWDKRLPRNPYGKTVWVWWGEERRPGREMPYGTRLAKRVRLLSDGGSVLYWYGHKSIGKRERNANDSWRVGWKVTKRDGTSIESPEWREYTKGRVTRSFFGSGPLHVFGREELARSFACDCRGVRPLVVKVLWRPWGYVLPRNKRGVPLVGWTEQNFITIDKMPRGTRLASEVVVV